MQKRIRNHYRERSQKGCQRGHVPPPFGPLRKKIRKSPPLIPLCPLTLLHSYQLIFCRNNYTWLTSPPYPQLVISLPAATSTFVYPPPNPLTNILAAPYKNRPTVYHSIPFNTVQYRSIPLKRSTVNLLVSMVLRMVKKTTNGIPLKTLNTVQYH